MSNSFILLFENLLSSYLANESNNLYGFMVGSATHSDHHEPGDVDILLIDPDMDTEIFNLSLGRLVNSILAGSPEADTFDMSDIFLKHRILDIASHACSLTNSGSASISYSFGPPKFSNTTSDKIQRVHVAGPVPINSLQLFRDSMPFHAAAFRRHNKTLFGPHLQTIIPDTKPTLYELAEWDTVHQRRYRDSKYISERLKIIRHMVAHRREVPIYQARFEEILRHADGIVTGKLAGSLQETATILTETLKALLAQSEPSPQAEEDPS